MPRTSYDHWMHPGTRPGLPYAPVHGIDWTLKSVDPSTVHEARPSVNDGFCTRFAPETVAFAPETAAFAPATAAQSNARQQKK